MKQLSLFILSISLISSLLQCSDEKSNGQAQILLVNNRFAQYMPAVIKKIAQQEAIIAEKFKALPINNMDAFIKFFEQYPYSHLLNDLKYKYLKAGQLAEIRIGIDKNGEQCSNNKLISTLDLKAIEQPELHQSNQDVHTTDNLII
jgi:hypothetical protein